MTGKPGRKPSIGDKARTERIILNVTPEMLADFKTIAFLNNQSMAQRIIALMQKDIETRASDLQTIRKMRNEE